VQKLISGPLVLTRTQNAQRTLNTLNENRTIH
jgi:hypothetical protein